MIYPVPKLPPKEKKPRTRLKVNKPLKAKSRLKAKNKNPLPEPVIKEVFERDNYQCQYCGSTYGLHPHHVKRRSEASKEWVHDKRNILTLCFICHGKTETEHSFYLGIQKLAVLRFGWFAGQAMTIEEWEDKYGR